MTSFREDIFFETLLCTKYGCKQYPNYNDNGKCTICMDRLNDTYVIKTACNHLFHVECLLFSFKYHHFKCIECDKSFEKIEK